jgi:hypothetical protein
VPFSRSIFCRIALLFITLLLVSTRFADAQQPIELAAGAEPAQFGSASLLAPPSAAAPLEIAAGFELLAINNIDDKAETFEFVGVLTLKWRDQRLAFDPAQEKTTEKVYQGDYQINEVFPGWSPQLVLINQTGLYETSASILRVQPDGFVVFSQMVNAVAEVTFSMRRHPFDDQRLEAVFGVFGFDKSKVSLHIDPDFAKQPQKQISIDQWSLTDSHLSTRELQSIATGNTAVSSAFVVTLGVQRDSYFMVRLVIFPLAFIVMLVWSVFWIDRAAIGDRVNICFVGILTAVAYQIVLGDRLPQISYMTFINGFLNISFIMMSATVVVNLVIGSLDRGGNAARADLIERRARWIFPSTYLGLVLLILAVSLLFF